MSSMVRGCGCLLVLTLLIGCGGTQTASKKTEESSLKPLSIMYGRYIAKTVASHPPMRKPSRNSSRRLAWKN